MNIVNIKQDVAPRVSFSDRSQAEVTGGRELRARRQSLTKDLDAKGMWRFAVTHFETHPRIHAWPSDMDFEDSMFFRVVDDTVTLMNDCGYHEDDCSDIEAMLNEFLMGDFSVESTEAFENLYY